MANKEVKRLQRKLIPVNIFVMLISLVAAVTLLFHPIIEINFLGHEDNLKQFFYETRTNETDDEIEAAVRLMSPIRFSITTDDAVKLAIADDPILTLADMIADVIRGAEDTIFTDFIKNMAEEAADGKDISGEATEIFARACGLETSNDPEGDIIKMADDAAGFIEGASGSEKAAFTQKFSARLLSFYRDTTIVNDGKFTVESAICAGYSYSAGLNTYEIDYSGLVCGLLAGDGEEARRATSDSVRQAGQIFSVFMGFFAAVWAVQALFALLHIIVGRRQFTMWYTKLWGAVPCLLFGVAPTLAANFLNIPQGFKGLLTAFSTTTWISGICYVALWAVSIFWAHPIKKKIKRAKYQTDED